MDPEVSVVIPTHDRLDVLPRVIAALEDQRDAPPFELIVVDDGSSDGTRQWLGERAFRVSARVVSQPNRGPAAARNRGVELAAGPIVAFLGDDTVPEPGWLAAHGRAHREGRGPLAVIGYTRWHERLRVSPFLRHINEHGLQFGYALIRDREDLPFNFFYSSNASLPRALLVAHPFDERFPHAAWEDTELGYRLTRRAGVRLRYLPEAVTAHDHPTTLLGFLARQERAGYAAVIFARLHPDLRGFLGLTDAGPPPLRPRGLQALLELAARATEKLPIATPRLWDAVVGYHYRRGLHRGWRERAGGAGAAPGPAEAR